MLPNLSAELKNILLELGKLAKGKITLSSKIILKALELDPICAGFIKSLLLENLPEKAINVNNLVAKSYSEAFRLEKFQVDPTDLLLSFVDSLAPAKYKELFLAIEIRENGKDSGTISAKTTEVPFTNITELAMRGKLPKIIGRKCEMEYILTSFLQRDRKSPLMVGPRGVGKTSIVYGLAQKIVNWDVPRSFLGAQIFLVDFFNGSDERGFSAILDSYIKYGMKAILFFDDINISPSGNMFNISPLPFRKYTGSPARDYPVDFIGASDDTLHNQHTWIPHAAEVWEEYRIPELSINVTERIVKSKFVKDPYYSGFLLEQKALEFLIKRAYEKEGYWEESNPGRALEFLNNAIAGLRLKSEAITKEELRRKERVDFISFALGQAIEENEFAKTIKLAEDLKKESGEIVKSLRVKKKIVVITRGDIQASSAVKKQNKGDGSREFDFEEDTGADGSLFVGLDKKIAESVVGQEKACQSLGQAVRRAESQVIRRGPRPAGSLLFLGPTGVGKTETAKVLAKILKGVYKLKTPNFLRLDMADFMERHTAARLVGSPPGYVGYDDGGQLTDFVAANPKSVILFDEIEKAHPDVLNMLLSIMEEGELTDGTGRTASFRDCIIILTSNIGSELLNYQEIGFDQKIPNNPNILNSPNAPNYEEIFFKTAKKSLKPEFVNRLDEIIVFKQLSKEDLLKIVDLQLAPIIKNLKDKKITVTFTDSAKEEILQKGKFNEYGAREIRRIIEKEVIDPINVKILNKSLKPGSVLEFSHL